MATKLSNNKRNILHALAEGRLLVAHFGDYRFTHKDTKRVDTTSDHVTERMRKMLHNEGFIAWSTVNSGYAITSEGMSAIGIGSRAAIAAEPVAQPSAQDESAPVASGTPFPAYGEFIILRENLPMFGKRNQMLYRYKAGHVDYDRTIEGDRLLLFNSGNLAHLYAAVDKDNARREEDFANGLADEYNTGSVTLITSPDEVARIIAECETGEVDTRAPFSTDNDPVTITKDASGKITSVTFASDPTPAPRKSVDLIPDDPIGTCPNCGAKAVKRTTYPFGYKSMPLVVYDCQRCADHADLPPVARRVDRLEDELAAANAEIARLRERSRINASKLDRIRDEVMQYPMNEPAEKLVNALYEILHDLMIERD